MKDYGRRKDKLAVVVVGEASESDSEEDEEVEEIKDHDGKYGKQQQEGIDHPPVAIETIGKYVDGKQVTDSKSSLLPRIACSINRNAEEDDDNGQHRQSRHQPSGVASSTLSPNKKYSTDSATQPGLNRTKDSLLHSLLRESNGSLKHNLINLSCTPYAMYNKDIGRITRHMIATQKHLQSGCALLQRATADINQLNKSFITLSSLMSGNKL